MLDDRTWLLIGRKMAKEASSQELRELETILRSNPELHFSLQTLTDLWQQDTSENTAELEAAYASLLDNMKSKGYDLPGQTDEDHLETAISLYRPKRFSKKTWLVALSTLGILLIATWLFGPFAKKEQPIATRESPSEISTRYGSKTNILLPDGSKVWLNAGSKITYDKNFGETTRDVTLTGEAYFDVVHNTGMPFIIHTRAMDIRVLGTEFNVKSYPEEKTTETSLIRGSIEVTLKDKRAEKILLKPNEKLVVSNEQENGERHDDSLVARPRQKEKKVQTPIISLQSLRYFSQDSTILETSWVNNRLIFEDESFGEIAVKMSRWYGVKFDFTDEEIRNLRFTGNFREESLNDALTAMQITADFRFIIEENNVTITKH